MTSSSSTEQAVAVRRPGRPRDARADHAILEAALDVASEVGLAETTVDAVAARAGVSKATIYRRWATKEVMLLDALGHVDIIDSVEGPDTGTLRGDLEAMAEQAARIYEDPRMALCLPDILAAARVSPELRPLAERLMQDKSVPMHTILLRAIARGELPASTDLDLVHAMLFGPVFFMMFAGKPVTIEQFQDVLDIVIIGLTAPDRRRDQSDQR